MMQKMVYLTEEEFEQAKKDAYDAGAKAGRDNDSKFPRNASAGCPFWNVGSKNCEGLNIAADVILEFGEATRDIKTRIRHLEQKHEGDGK